MATRKKKVLEEKVSDNPQVQEDLAEEKKDKKWKPRVFTEAELAAPRTHAQFRRALRRKLRNAYDAQELRLQLLGRLTKKADDAAIDMHPSDILLFQNRLQDFEIAENNAFNDLFSHLQEVPFYKQVIEPERKGQFKGLGPKMAPIIVASFDIEREDTPSKMHSFAGLATLTARRCKHCTTLVVGLNPETGADATYKVPAGQRDWGDTTEYAMYRHPPIPKQKNAQGELVEVKPRVKCAYINGTIPLSETFASSKQMRPVAGEKLRYNAWLRMKLCGVLAPVLLRCGSPYKMYYDNRRRYNTARKWGICPLHEHRDAMRYMIKMLLTDIWMLWRRFEGLPVRPTYQEEKLGHKTSMKPIEPSAGLSDIEQAMINEAVEGDNEDYQEEDLSDLNY
jgi:hypothetical protein